MSRRRLDVTPTQAVASMLATLTGAIAASSLGIAGTIIGAAIMSFASTVGAAIYKHYLARGHEGLRAAASGTGIAAAVLGHQSLDPEETARLRPDGPAEVESRDDADAQPASRRPAAGRRAGAANSTDARVRTALAGRAGLAGPARPGQAGLGFTADEHPVADLDADGTTTARLRSAAGQRDIAYLGDAAALGGAARLRVLGSRAGAGTANADGASGPVTADGPDGAASGRDKPTSGRQGTRPGARRWLVLAGAIVGAFVVAMAAVTAVEAIAGKPLETLIWHRPGSGSGTTIGSVVGHQAQHRPAPSQSPSAQPSSTSPGLVSPTPTPSESVIPSSGTSSGPGAGASAGTGTQAQGATPALG